MNIYLIFFAIVGFCIYILFGLHMTEGIESITQKTLTWIIYTMLWATFINVFSLGYFWSVIKDKTGPYGLRGPEGETGMEGNKGSCILTDSQAYCLQSINEYINKLYKSYKNQDILNEETQTFPCDYLNEKIKTMATSRQFQIIVADLSNDNKGIDNIVNYLKSIWKTWFDLIYNATSELGSWFIDEYGDENYEWVGSDPFDEIKKYDIYYWGITRSFRPLKAEICRSTSTYNNSKLPQLNLPQEEEIKQKLEPRLKIIRSNDYNTINDDKRSGAAYDATWYRPKMTTIGNETYYPVGDVIVTQYGIKKKGPVIVGNKENWKIDDTGPDIKTILVSGDVVSPDGYTEIQYHGSQDAFGTYKINCPDQYVDMGNITRSYNFPRDNPKFNQDPNYFTYVYNRNDDNMRFNSPYIDQIKCVPADCVEPISANRSGLWFQRGTVGHETVQYNGADRNEAIAANGYNLYRAAILRNQPFYKIKDQCLIPQIVKSNLRSKLPASIPLTKDVEPEFANLGIGWNGHPYKLDPKYSIFSFLNLVPEGMIVNKGTGQRFYIVHYGGEDVNIYNILVYEKSTNKFNYALQLNSSGTEPTQVPTTLSGVTKITINNAPLPRIISKPIDKLNINQQWKLILNDNDKKKFTIKNVANNKYLYIGQEDYEGLSAYTTIDLANKNYKTDPAFLGLTDEEIMNRTTFSFISSFGTQLDIIDKK